MYNPELRYIIEQDHREVMPLIPNNLFVAVLMIEMTIILTGCTFTGSYKIAMIPFEYLWSILTPGNELLELALIASSIFAGVMWILTMNELTKKLDISFEKLKTQLKEKDLRIVELESELEGLKNEDKYNNISKNK